MKRLQVFSLFVMTLLVLAPLAPLASAAPLAQSNLLANGGFESGGSGSGTASWLPWWAESAKPADGSFNYAYRPSWNQENLSAGAAGAFVYAGNSSQRVVNNWDPWWAGVKQVANAPAGARVRFTAYVRAWASANNWPAASDTTVPVGIRIGLEPSGNENQFASTVVWSGSASPHDTWQALSVETTVGASGKVLAVISADYRGSSRLFLSAMFDEASLVVVGQDTSPTNPPPTSGGGTSAPVQPTSPPVTRAPFVFPTPGADGNIVYTVQSGDTGWSIAANAGLTLQQLQALNPNVNLGLVFVGQKLVIGQGRPSQPTAAPQPTTDPNAVTATPEPQPSPTQSPAGGEPTTVAVANTGKMCVRLYEDVNGNATRDTSETPLAGGLLTLLDAATGSSLQTHTTIAGEVDPWPEHCFENLAPGVYTIASAPPTGYNPTTANNARLEVQASQSVNIEFGAQVGSGTVTTPNTSNTGSMRAALFGAVGVMLILLAAGVGAFLFLRRR
jgi:LysM repeat protein